MDAKNEMLDVPQWMAWMSWMSLGCLGCPQWMSWMSWMDHCPTLDVQMSDVLDHVMDVLDVL